MPKSILAHHRTPEAVQIPFSIDFGMQLTREELLRSAVKDIAFLNDELLVLNGDIIENDYAARSLNLVSIDRDGEANYTLELQGRRSSGYASIAVGPDEVQVAHMISNSNGNRVKFSTLTRLSAVKDSWSAP